MSKSTALCEPKQDLPALAEAALNPDHCPGILPHHLRELRASGLTNDTIQAAGIYSETDSSKLAAILGWRKYRPSMGPAIVFPYPDDQGRNGYCRIKPYRPRTVRGKPVKYESPKDRPNEIYLPRGVAEVLPDASRELLLTEGEKKALAATQHGFPCIGLVGVSGWKPKGKMALLPALERAAWQGRQVYIAYDSDRAHNPDVQQAESQLADHLASRGAKVKCCQLPDGPPDESGNPTKQGLDDYLATQADPKKAMRALLDTAEEPTPPDAGSMKLAAGEIDAYPEASAFLVLSERDGVPRMRFWRGAFHLWGCGAYAELPLSDVRGRLIEYLDQGYCKLSAGIVSNVVDCLKAKARMGHLVESPAWIGEPPADWPADEVLACRDTIVHLKSLVDGSPDYQRPATPRLFTTNALDYNFATDAPAPTTWLEFLSGLWPNEAESIATLQEWFGYCLTPDTRQQKILLVVGPKRSGKGTIGRVLRATIGRANVCGPTLASIGTNFGLWPFVGKSLAIISDARLGGRTDSQVVVERLLSISGEDCLTIDRKNLEPVTGKLPTRLMILSNELPRLGDSSGALAGRMILLRLTESFYGREDHALTDKLLAELPGILLWAIEGWRRLRERGRFVQPTAAEEMRAELEDLGSPISAFLRERCHVGPEYEVPRAELHKAFAAWCRDKGKHERYVPDEIGFGRDLRAALPTISDRRHRVDGDCRRFYTGVGLKGF